MIGDILGSGSLAAKEVDRRAGTATFPVRGEFPMVMDTVRRESSGWQARLRVGIAETTVSLVPAITAIDGRDGFLWLGTIVITGYPMRVHIDPETWAVVFLDEICAPGPRGTD